jgi:hypothetical protein
MKRIVLAGATCLAMAFPAFGQTTTVTPGTTTVTPGASATVTIAPEQRTRIKRYVTERRVTRAPIRERVTVGATLPADVELVEVPSDWGPELSRYRYVVHEDNVVLVEPSSRRVVTVID